MSPDQIALVRSTWALALGEGDVLEAAVARGLSGTPHENAERARWAIGSITRLVIVLDRPTDFVAPAQSELARLPRLTLEELGDIRESVLAALRRAVTALPAGGARAWAHAFALFEELLAAQHLDPFHPPATTTTDAGTPGPTQET